MARSEEHFDQDHDDDAGDDARPSHDGAGAAKRLPLWSKMLLVVSVILMVVGLGMRGYAYFSDGGDGGDGGGGGGEGRSNVPPAAVDGDGGPDLVQGLQPTDGQGGADVEPDRDAAVATDGEDVLDLWSPVVFRLGFSFFAGFVIAYAVRTFLKISFLVLGVAILGLFGLQYAGVVDVKWDAISGYFDGFTGWLGDQTESFRAFITGRLPSTAAAAAGLIAGFRKK